MHSFETSSAFREALVATTAAPPLPTGFVPVAARAGAAMLWFASIDQINAAAGGGFPAPFARWVTPDPGQDTAFASQPGSGRSTVQ